MSEEEKEIFNEATSEALFGLRFYQAAVAEDETMFNVFMTETTAEERVDGLLAAFSLALGGLNELTGQNSQELIHEMIEVITTAE